MINCNDKMGYIIINMMVVCPNMRDLPPIVMVFFLRKLMINTVVWYFVWYVHVCSNKPKQA